jgi:carbon-monoxide dehydrogenase large subunit
MGWIGTSVKRVEDPALLTGKGRFVDDMHLPNMLQAAMVRSPHAHALIRGIDASDALAMPGVHAVLTHADLPEAFQQQIPSLVPNAAIRYLVTQRALAMDAVHFAGEAVARWPWTRCISPARRWRLSSPMTATLPKTPLTG